MSLIMRRIGKAVMAAAFMAASGLPAFAQSGVNGPQPTPFRGSRADTSAPGIVPNSVQTPADRFSNSPYPSVRIPAPAPRLDQPSGRIGGPLPPR